MLSSFVSMIKTDKYLPQFFFFNILKSQKLICVTVI